MGDPGERCSLLFSLLTDWALAVGARDIAKLPGGAWTGLLDKGDDQLTVTINANKEEAAGIPAFHAEIKSRKDLAVALVSPAGGSMIGFSEDDLVEIFRQAAQEGCHRVALAEDRDA